MDDAEVSPTGALYRFDAAGLHRADDGYVITNGPATSPDGRTLYHIDTLERVIFAFDLAADGSLSARRVFARVAEKDGHPDGPVVDATRMRVVGLFGGWGVNRYSPTGELLSKLSLPVANCTKAAFGGAICARCTSRAPGKGSLPSSARSSRSQADCSPCAWTPPVCRRTKSRATTEHRAADQER
jgi:sugar lactone lactonase YvrE